jgi:transcriptional regulator with XRE-family HTH domain
LLWERISQVLSEQQRQHTDLWQVVIRDKNTYTNWRKGRTVPSISDLEEIAAALHVSPVDLLRPSQIGPTLQIAEQLELPFEPGRKGAVLDVEYTAGGFILKLPLKSA